MIQTIGWLGSILFSVCGLPQAIKVHRDGNADGLDISFLGLWTGGEILTLIAVYKDVPRPYLLFNYVMNLVFLIVMWRYKFYPRRAV